MKIPFDIKYKPQIESGKYKVETRDGRPVRIICWDANSYTPVVFLATEHDDLDDKDKEYQYSCNNFGRSFSGNSPSDLFIITPEPELSEFEKALEVFLMNADSSEETFHQEVKKHAAKLFELAKDEIYSHESLVEYAKIAKAEGKAEALKDLPRWKNGTIPKGELAIRQVGISQHAYGVVLGGFEDSTPTQRYILISDLEKLPGFNE